MFSPIITVIIVIIIIGWFFVVVKTSCEIAKFDVINLSFQKWFNFGDKSILCVKNLRSYYRNNPNNFGKA